MDEEMKLRQEIAAGQAAEAELRIVGEAFAELKASYVAAWEQTSARDSDARERLWQAVQVVGRVEQHLRTIVDNGALARRQIDDVAQRKRRGLFG